MSRVVVVVFLLIKRRLFIKDNSDNLKQLFYSFPRFSSRRSGFKELNKAILGSDCIPNPPENAGIAFASLSLLSATASTLPCSACGSEAPKPEAMLIIFAIASGSESTLFSFSEKSLSKVYTPLAQKSQNFLAFFLPCRIDKLLRILGANACNASL